MYATASVEYLLFISMDFVISVGYGTGTCRAFRQDLPSTNTILYIITYQHIDQQLQLLEGGFQSKSLEFVNPKQLQFQGSG